MPPEERRTWIASLDEKEAIDVLYDWGIWARENQLEPPQVMDNGELWTTWLILAGRGYGKTRTGSETVIKWAREGACKRMALVAEDAADARDVMVEGESGILACSPPDFYPRYEPSKRRLTWPNGAIATLYSAEDYDSLRGPQFDGAWCDELCKWRYAQEAWDNLQFGMRLGKHPRQIVTTTPRPIKLLKDIIKRRDTYITTGSTWENLENLAPAFRLAVIEKYQGTRLGQQELEAKLLEDVPGALWNRINLDEHRVLPYDPVTPIKLPDMVEIAVAIDPATTSDEEKSNETGLIVVGRDYNGHGYVLADLSGVYTPDEWGKAAVRAFDQFKANLIIYETNQGGEMVQFVIASAARALKDAGERNADFVPMRGVHASRGKATRAEPISALYEQGRISHVGTFAALEDQMVEFTADFDRKKSGYSPDRVDALVWGFTAVICEGYATAGIMDFYRQEAQEVQDRLSGRDQRSLSTALFVQLVAPPGSSTVYGREGDKYTVGSDGLVKVKETDAGILMSIGFKKPELEVAA